MEFSCWRIKSYAPILPIRERNELDAQFEEQPSVLVNKHKFCKQLLGAVDFPHLEKSVEKQQVENEEFTDQSSSNDSESYASFISLVDYIDFSDSDTSHLASIPTYGSDDNSYQWKTDDESEEGLTSNLARQPFSDVLKLSNHCQRGFGRPDEWIRPHDTVDDMPESQKQWKGHRSVCWSDSSHHADDDSEDSKCNHHSERGFGRPDDWVRPRELYEESSECSRSETAKRNSHGERTWMQQIDSPEASTERRSCGSPLAPRTLHDKSSRESPLGRNKGRDSSSGRVTLDDYLEFHSGHTSEKSEETSKTSSTEYDSEEDSMPRTPQTLEKNGSVQYDDEELNIKLWWHV